MKALITGGAGFIGSNITKLLIAHGYEVTVMDNLSSGNIANIQRYIDEKEIHFFEADIRDSDEINKAMRGQDVVFHLAACVGRQKSIDDPMLDSSTNLLGTVNVLESMNKNDVHRIVYSSSAAIFGELKTPSIDEDHPQNADSPYGVSKLAAEKMILAYGGITDITGVCLRYFNIYGINQRFDRYGNVIPIFAKQIYGSEPITIYGDGTQTRDFLNVQDVAFANLKASLSEKTDVYNLGSGGSMSINDLAEMMMRIAGIRVNIKYAPERPADVKHCKANIDKASDALNFAPTVELEHGLVEYMKWYKDSFTG